MKWDVCLACVTAQCLRCTMLPHTSQSALSWLDDALLCARTPCNSPIRHVWVSGGPRRGVWGQCCREWGPAVHSGPRFPSLKASRLDWALCCGTGFCAATRVHAAWRRRVPGPCADAHGGLGGVEGEATAAREVCSGAAPAATRGQVFAPAGDRRERSGSAPGGDPSRGPCGLETRDHPLG